MIQSARRLALPATATLAVVATIVAPATASAALVATHFQQRVDLVCASGCTAKFIKLAANEALNIDHVTCEVTTGGEVVVVSIALLPDSLKFSIPLGLAWQREFLGANVFTFSAETNMRVPVGRQAQVVVMAGGSPVGSCSITGTKLTNN